MSITQSVGGLLQSAAAATGVGTALAVQGEGSVVFTLSGTFVGTVTFQGSEDGTTFENIPATRISTGVSANTATTPGLYQASIAGMQLVRANITSYTSGSITATAHAVPLGAAGSVADRVVQQASGSTSGTLQNAATATGFGTPLSLLGHSAVILTVSGTFVGTVTFQGTEDGSMWGNLSAVQLGTSNIGPTATGAGLFEIACAGLTSIRANITAYTSGSITVTAHAVPLPFNAHVVNSNATMTTLISGEDQTNNRLRVEIVPVDADSIIETEQLNVNALGNGTAIDMKGYHSLVVDVTIASFVGTVTFECTIDDANWVAIGLKTIADGAAATTTTAAGMFKMPNDVGAISQFRARISAYTSGTVTVKSRKHPR